MNIDKNSPDSLALNFDAPEASSAPVTELPPVVPANAAAVAGPAASSPEALRAALPKIPQQITISFDIGHSSIGWAVFGETKTEISGEFVGATYPDLLGAGTVLFEKDGCLASQRRAHRRVRRNIAARRQRVARLKRFLLSLGVISKEDADANPTAFPWLLAARVLASDGKEKLSWLQLWCVLRWYAHNRGYDGNALWAGDSADADEERSKKGGKSAKDGDGFFVEEYSEESAEEKGQKDDKKRVAEARKLMAQNKTETMAETICAVLKVDPFGEKTSSRIYFKGKKVAFPRTTVQKEIRDILNAHVDVLEKLDANTVSILVGDVANPRRDTLNDELRKNLRIPSAKRFVARGGLLFGQVVPRFDNRIIGTCRITGEKLPLKKCREFMLFRWAGILNKLSVFDGIDENGRRATRRISPRERELLTARVAEKGFFASRKELSRALQEISGCDPANVSACFQTKEDLKALVFDPVRKFIATELKEYWPYFSARGKKIFASKLAGGKVMSLQDCVDQMIRWGDWPQTQQDALDVARKAGTGKNKKIGRLANPILRVAFPSGRASYCREILKKVYDEALAGTNSTQVGGCLYETEEIRRRQMGDLEASVEKWLASQTNNHLVRHRMLIFSRLLEDIIADYASGDWSRVTDVIVEVVRELSEFSGLSNKEIEAKRNEQGANNNGVVSKLEKAIENWNAINPSNQVSLKEKFRREARILEDQNFICPYTGSTLSYADLFGGELESDHIIPRSVRASDSLHSLVMTFRQVNQMKENRTAMQFVKEFQGQPVKGRENISVRTEASFKEWAELHKRHKNPSQKGRLTEEEATAESTRVEKLEEKRVVYKKADFKRCQMRAKLLLTDKYDKRMGEHTEGDLTKTSYLNKIAISLVRREFEGKRGLKVNVRQIAGSITAFMRTRMKINECLVAAVPRLRGLRKVPKAVMREQTHLHHAMDAVALGLVGSLFKIRDLKYWSLLIKSSRTREESEMLRKKYSGLLIIPDRGDVMMRSLPKCLISNVIEKLKECRVVRHVPAKMSGMKVEETTWKLAEPKYWEKDEHGVVVGVRLRQSSTEMRDDGTGKVSEKCYGNNDDPAKPSKLLGFGGPEGKLKAIKGVVIIEKNYGVALDPTPTVIPFFKVHEKLRALRERNNGRFPRVLRKGMRIEVPTGRYKGSWEILTVQDAKKEVKVDMIMPDRVKAREKGKRLDDAKREVPLRALLKDGMKILKTRLTGTPTEE